jgi:uncharacterized protein YdeI (YjbR/CyaY-like superfamily)
MNPKVDEFLSKTKKWKEELSKLRNILLECGLTEELKWKNPCYTFQNKNIILLGSFKEWCVISFLKGVLLNDENSILIAAGENSQSTKIIKFTNIEEIIQLKPTLKAYIFEAMEVEKLGLKVELKKNDELEFVEELQNKLDENADFKMAFENLTLGRQRGYNLYFSAAKQSKTRISRIENYMQRIFDGKGINDCTCGLSKKMPSCDGSHKFA